MYSLGSGLLYAAAVLTLILVFKPHIERLTRSTIATILPIDGTETCSLTREALFPATGCRKVMAGIVRRPIHSP